MKHIILILGLLISTLAFGQESKTIEYLPEAKEVDFSDLWSLDSILVENRNLIERKQPLGFIGNDFQRFYIRFISVIQNPKNTLEYLVYGKTKVKNNICDFQGKINISTARIYLRGDLPNLKQGYILGDYNFYEDKDQKHTGFFTGHFKTHFYFDSNDILQYDAISFVADGFENNQFEGIWTSYENGQKKKCNWGDYRIPDSQDLDTGTAEFATAKKYDDFGWKYYNLAWGYPKERPGVKEALELETKKWWIEK